MQDLQPGSVESVNATVAQAIAEKCFGIQASADELPSERDRNFLLTARDGERFVLKFANANEQRETLEAQNAILDHLKERVPFCPRVVPALSGEQITVFENNLVRVLTYLPGKPLATIENRSPELLYDLGRKLGQLSCALVGFDHPGAHRAFHWDLAEGAKVLKEYGPQIKKDWLRKLVLSFRPNVGELRRSVVHGDANDYNVLVQEDRVVGLIDFGDIVYSYTAGDLAIALAYVILGKRDPKALAAPVIAGYREEFELNKDELDALWQLVRLRLCMSVCIAAHQQKQRPENEYLGISQGLIEETLPQLINE